MAAQNTAEYFHPEDVPNDDTHGKTESSYHQSEHTSSHETPHHFSNEVKTLLSWHAPGRPFKKRGKSYYMTGLLLMIIIEIVLLLFQMQTAMLAVGALVFLTFVLATVPPSNYHYRISTEGVTIEDHFYLWQELYDFYFKKVHDVEVLHIRTHDFIPGELKITLGPLHKDHVKSVLLPYLPYREIVRQTFIEKSGDWLAKTFPLEK